MEAGTELKLDIKESDGIFYTVHIVEHDMYFSSHIEKGMDMVNKKAKAMVESKCRYVAYLEGRGEKF